MMARSASVAAMRPMIGRLPRSRSPPQPMMTKSWFCVWRSEEHTSELQSLMRISYAVFCLKKKNHGRHKHIKQHSQYLTYKQPGASIAVRTNGKHELDRKS